jgi:hypothetical protein
MRVLLLLPLLLMSVPLSQNPAATTEDGSSVVVLGFKWFKTRQVGEKIEPEDKTPARAVIPENKNFQRNARINDSIGARDPNADTIDGRSAAIEKNVQEARTPKTKPVDGFAYRVKVQNASAKAVEIIFWEYQFIDPANPATVARRQFLCGVQIKSDKEKELQAFSSFSPTDVVSAESLANKSGSPLQEKVVINRVEYADGSIWQRKDWNFAEVRTSIARAIAAPWGAEMCRRL